MLLARIVSIFLLILIIPISIFMDSSFFWENSTVEMGQNLILGLATLTCLYWVVKEKNTKGLWFTGALLFFIAMLRELSWGRVLFVKGIGNDGPIIVEKAALWFGPYINIFVGLLLIILLISLIYNRKTIKIMLKTLIHDKESIVYFCLLALLLSAASLLFDRNVIKAIAEYHQGFEEMSEITAYWAALSLAIRIHYLKEHK